MLLSRQAMRAVPRDPAVRAAIRRAAVQPATGEREALAAAADRVLSGLGLGREHTGYAMIACANACWRGPRPSATRCSWRRGATASRRTS